MILIYRPSFYFWSVVHDEGMSTKYDSDILVVYIILV